MITDIVDQLSTGDDIAVLIAVASCTVIVCLCLVNFRMIYHCLECCCCYCYCCKMKKYNNKNYKNSDYNEKEKLLDDVI